MPKHVFYIALEKGKRCHCKLSNLSLNIYNCIILLYSGAIGMFSLDYPETVALHFRERSQIVIAVSVHHMCVVGACTQQFFPHIIVQTVLAECREAVIQVDIIRGNEYRIIIWFNKFTEKFFLVFGY